MARRFENRTCIVCGTEWTVETKAKGMVKQCFCKTCRATLTAAEKQNYYRVHEGSHIL